MQEITGKNNMAYGDFEKDVDDAKIFDMMISGDLRTICPKCGKLNIVQPDAPCIMCVCLETYISPLFKPGV